MNEYEDIHVTVAREIENLVLDCLSENKKAKEETLPDKTEYRVDMHEPTIKTVGADEPMP